MTVMAIEWTDYETRIRWQRIDTDMSSIGYPNSFRSPEPEEPKEKKPKEKTAQPLNMEKAESPFFPPAGANDATTVPWESMAYDSKGGMYRPVPSNVLPPAPPPTGVPRRLAIAFMMAEAIAIVSAFILAQTLY